jgi:hypothetical protein
MDKAVEGLSRLGQTAEGVKSMAQNNKKKPKEKAKKEKKKKADPPVPFCTTAPSAEHARAPNDDEPCDDSRGKKQD